MFGDIPLPPPVARKNCFEIKSGDCEACPHWAPGDQGLLGKLRRKRVTARRRRRKQPVEKV